jgi:outer membrane protein TolC
VNDYRQVVLNAWQEVTTSQADLNASARRGASSALQLELAVAQMERAHSLEKAGLATRLDTLSAQAGVASATMSTADELGQFIQNWARMQKAMYVVGPAKAPA